MSWGLELSLGVLVWAASTVIPFERRASSDDVAETRNPVNVRMLKLFESGQCFVRKVKIRVPSGARVEFQHDEGGCCIVKRLGKGQRECELTVFADMIQRSGKTGSLKLINVLGGGKNTRLQSVEGKTFPQLISWTLRPGDQAMDRWIPIYRFDGRVYSIRVTERKRK